MDGIAKLDAVLRIVFDGDRLAEKRSRRRGLLGKEGNGDEKEGEETEPAGEPQGTNAREGETMLHRSFGFGGLEYLFVGEDLAVGGEAFGRNEEVVGG